jgi:hypothetical protein
MHSRHPSIYIPSNSSHSYCYACGVPHDQISPLSPGFSIQKETLIRSEVYYVCYFKNTSERNSIVSFIISRSYLLNVSFPFFFHCIELFFNCIPHSLHFRQQDGKATPLCASAHHGLHYARQQGCYHGSYSSIPFYLFFHIASCDKYCKTYHRYKKLAYASP